MQRLRLVAIMLGGVVFVGLVASLVGEGDGRAPKRVRLEGDAGGGRSGVHGGDASSPASDGLGGDSRATKRELARSRARFAGSDARRLGDRLDGSQAELDEPADGGARGPRVVVPTRGEGAEADGWDGLSPETRIDRARREIESALAQAETAATDEERDEWRARASHALGAVRADFYASADAAGYAALESRIEG